MQAVILAAGEGRRMLPLSSRTPKTLLEVGGMPILLRTLDALPAIVTEAHIVVRYRADQIVERVGNEHKGKRVVYHYQGTDVGTASALDCTRHALINKSPFLALCGDDIYDSTDLAAMTSFKHARGVIKRSFKDQNALDSTWLGTGAFSLDDEYFRYPVCHSPRGERSLPHTVAQMVCVHQVEFKKWIQINTPEQLALANALLNTPL